MLVEFMFAARHVLSCSRLRGITNNLHYWSRDVLMNLLNNSRTYICNIVK